MTSYGPDETESTAVGQLSKDARKLEEGLSHLPTRLGLENGCRLGSERWQSSPRLFRKTSLILTHHV